MFDKPLGLTFKDETLPFPDASGGNKVRKVG